MFLDRLEEITLIPPRSGGLSLVSELLKSPRVLGLPGENDLSQSPHVPWEGKLRHAPPRRKSARLVGPCFSLPIHTGAHHKFHEIRSSESRRSRQKCLRHVPALRFQRDTGRFLESLDPAGKSACATSAPQTM